MIRLRIAPTRVWAEYKNKTRDTILKLGARSGATIGAIDSIEVEYDSYRDMIGVAATHMDPFAEKGDGGSIYFAPTSNGYIPLGIHRISDHGVSYASEFLEGFKNLLEKGNLGDIEEWEPCVRNSSCSFSHTKHLI